ncbi:MAG: VWA domain-containing protein [Chloroflexi bacterium]|nr:VWA domain-containing protein [Chloroflexota bacterium]
MSTSYLDNYYARLGVSRGSASEDIRSAYYQAARRLHPDTNDDPTATELFLQIQEAYETLSDDKKRADYDKTLPVDIDPPPDILINPLYSRAIIPQIDNQQLVYILLDLMALPNKTDETEAINPPLNIGLVLDNSTSMAGARMDMVKSTATQIVRGLRPMDSLAIITFNDRADVIVPATKDLDQKIVESRISQLKTGGGTEILQGLEAGFNEVGRYLNPSTVNHIILVTDGRTYGDEEGCQQLATNAAKKGITINGLGIGSEWNDNFMDKLVSTTGGNSVYAANPEDIKHFLTKQFSRLSETYADQVAMEIDTGPDVELRYTFRLSPDPGPLTQDSPINIGTIPLGPSLTILMEFVVKSIPPDVDTLTLAEGKLSLEIPTRPIPATSSRFSFTRPTSANPDLEPPPQALIKAMSRLSLYRLQEQARRELEAGEIEKATTRMQNLATQLLMSGEPSLAHTVMLELKQIEGGNSISEEAEKRIKYGTRALLLPVDERSTP